MNDLSDALRRRRLVLGLSLAQVARRADTSVAALSRYENGWDRFSVRTLRKLAGALDSDVCIRLVPVKRSGPVAPDRDRLVQRLGRLFWERELEPGHLDSHPLWVLERVLEVGQLEDVLALRDWWGRERFLDGVERCRFTSPRTKQFWEAVLAKEGRGCTRKFSRPAAFAY